MKTFNKIILILTVIVIQSCSNNDDNDCSTVLCAQPVATLDFQIVDIETGENIAGTVIPGEAIEVTNTSSETEAEYEFLTENNINILRIFISESSDYSISYGNEEIFTLSVDAERQTEGCCSTTMINDLNIEAAEFELEAETGIYVIKKEIRSHIVTGESLENYHAFFENSQLKLEAEDESHVNTESLKLDVIPGDKIVFKLLTYDDPEETVADDEVTKIVYFEIDPEVTEFTLNPDNFEAANAVIGVVTNSSYIKPIESGEIIGAKISDNEWQVEINVAAGEESESFYLQIQESKRGYNRSTYEDVWMPIYRTHIFN